MPTTYKELRDRVLVDTVMNTLYHAERLVKVENLGLQEDDAAWNQTIADAVLSGEFFIGTVSADTEEDGMYDGGQSLNRMEGIVLQCFKDPATLNTANELIGGIDQPNLNLGISRIDNGRDPLNGKPYMFVREVQGSSETMWRLLFRREIQGVRGIEL